jgi:hypothetical protein
MRIGFRKARGQDAQDAIAWPASLTVMPAKRFYAPPYSFAANYYRSESTRKPAAKDRK